MGNNIFQDKEYIEAVKDTCKLYDEYKSLRKVAEILGVAKSTIQRRLKRAEEELTYIPGADDENFNNYISPETYKPATYTVKKDTVKIVAIGDVHDSPDLPDKARFRWFGRFVAEKNPDVVVQIGDIGDFDSCSTHQNPGTIDYALRPTISQDFESLEEALDNYFKIVPNGPDFLLTKGNHENRLDRFENSNPEVEGRVVSGLDKILKNKKIKVYEYGQWLFLNNIGFIHCPMTQMGNPYGGKNPENQIGNDAIFSIAWGHTHKGGFKSFPKIGPMMNIEVVNLGCAMPANHIKKYASRSTTGWTYGVWELTLRDNHVTSYSFVSMEELENKFKD